MSWRVESRTPRVLATALEKLADLAKGPDETDATRPAIAEEAGGAATSTGGAEEEGTAPKARATREEMLLRGEEVTLATLVRWTLRWVSRVDMEVVSCFSINPCLPGP